MRAAVLALAAIIALGLALGGCTFPTKPGPPFGCVGDNLPTTAPEIVEIRGTVTDPFAPGLPLVGAIETVFVISASSPVPVPLPSATTDSTGRFTVREPTAGAPHMQFIESKLAGYLDSVAYSALPVASDVDVTVLQFTQSEIDSLVAARLLPAIDPAKGVLLASVVDCNDNAAGGATLTVQTSNPGDDIKTTYLTGNGPDLRATQTDTSVGAAIVSGLSPGSVKVSAILGTTPYRDSTVTAMPGVLTLTEVTP